VGLLGGGLVVRFLRGRLSVGLGLGCRRLRLRRSGEHERALSGESERDGARAPEACAATAGSPCHAHLLATLPDPVKSRSKHATILISGSRIGLGGPRALDRRAAKAENAGMTQPKHRTEKDTFGPIEVPADRLWGA